jgi:hypothetical protein
MIPYGQAIQLKLDALKEEVRQYETKILVLERQFHILCGAYWKKIDGEPSGVDTSGQRDTR